VVLLLEFILKTDLDTIVKSWYTIIWSGFNLLCVNCKAVVSLKTS